MMRLPAERVSDFGKIRYRASLLSLRPTIPKSVPLSLFRIVITRFLLTCALRWRSADGFCHSVYTCGLPQFSITWEKRAVLVLRSFTSGMVGTARRPFAAPFKKKKPARELRQEGSYYRCCIPALAGFVSPQSIAPDGGEISPRQSDAQLENAEPDRAHGVFWETCQHIDNVLRFCLRRAREMARVCFANTCFRCGDILYHAC